MLLCSSDLDRGAILSEKPQHQDPDLGSQRSQANSYPGKQHNRMGKSESVVESLVARSADYSP